MATESDRRIRLRRDSQQWEYDRTVKETGRVYHFQPNGRGGLPESVKQHDMISKHVGKQAVRLEKLGDTELAAGHRVTALEQYFEAGLKYAQAQHPVLVNNPEKKHLHAGALRCFEQVRELSPYPIERIEIPWQGKHVAGYLHLADTTEPAPLIFFIPGCDMTKEFLPHPHFNWARNRGAHLFVFDGPGQGECNIQDIAVTLDNYEDAARAALDVLIARPDVDADRVGLYAMSFGAWWGVKVAATDDRYAAAAFPWASICDKHYLFEEESPRYKQLFAFLTRAQSEEELDRFIAGMGVDDILPRIKCPSLLTVGEYDPRSPLEEVYEHFDSMTAPAELWVFADQHHATNTRANSGVMWSMDMHSMGMDWLLDRMSGRPFDRAGTVTYVEASSAGPYDPANKPKRRWYES
jgi:dienelactone hydrolase